MSTIKLRKPFVTRLLNVAMITILALIGQKISSAKTVAFGDTESIFLGDSLTRFQRLFPKATRTPDWSDGKQTLQVFVLSKPDSVDADMVRFIFSDASLIQMDHIFSKERLAARGGWQFDYESLSELFGTQGKSITVDSSDLRPPRKMAFHWNNPSTRERASLDVFENGSSEVTFSLGLSSGKSSPTAERKNTIALPDSQTNPFTKVRSHETGPLSKALSENRPENGAVLLRTSSSGGGELKIMNGTKWDAIVKLVSPQRKYTFLVTLVHAGKTAVIQKIRPNTYKMIFALGEGWDVSKSSFYRIIAASEFDRPLIFERSDGFFTKLSVTLHSVEDGNAGLKSIPEEKFSEY